MRHILKIEDALRFWMHGFVSDMSAQLAIERAKGIEVSREIWDAFAAAGRIDGSNAYRCPAAWREKSIRTEPVLIASRFSAAKFDSKDRGSHLGVAEYTAYMHSAPIARSTSQLIVKSGDGIAEELKMNVLLQFLQTHAVLVVFVVVLLSQLGLPLPAVPAIVTACAVNSSTSCDIVVIALFAVFGALTADIIWFSVGRRYGRSIITGIVGCGAMFARCIHNTERAYHRTGTRLLVGAKFAPFTNAIASALAGTTGKSVAHFAFFSVVGTISWVGCAVTIGVIAHTSINVPQLHFVSHIAGYFTTV